ncbi:hypothetical protein COEREDRAFT_84234 [Coemansia reversa NRRL 1564]|uniref:ISXO2-like transposase domain-containing protein n=1 Tax=Coemansia reversa (strain ATCC 12441 / NRRL 1564) TaxID=763665 RepID=A0A2G5BKQ7_COERN|nr:hypothetical protein COEREDRAFT_84234 [Coemansia reversa NRRL 1564]|eukprot:PIA19604.1 hypothetical protein COEREDRAFT_84234 [Coemansia reversa NRRL 1564]
MAIGFLEALSALINGKYLQDRNESTLIAAIKTHIILGSIIYSDEWKEYQKINELEMYTHYTINNSEGFAKPISGIHTNTIKGTWNALKSKIDWHYYNQEQLLLQIYEFQWRRSNKSDIGTRGFQLLKYYID